MAKHDKKMKKKIDYDKEHDILFIHKGFSDTRSLRAILT